MLYRSLAGIIAVLGIVALLQQWPGDAAGQPDVVKVEEPPAATIDTATAMVDVAADKSLSPARRLMLTRMLAGVADATFNDANHKAFWFSLLAAESRFNGKARSTAGAVGLGQLLPGYREDFGRTCGITKVATDDLADDYTNATLSACYFRELIARHNNNVPLALVAYNAGMNSSSLKSAAAGGSPAHEPSAYVTRIWVGHEKATRKDK